MMIGIAGGSGSGKSTIAKGIVELLGPKNVTHIMQDNYYRRNDHLSERDSLNYDHPDAIEFELLSQQLRSLTKRQPVEVPIYDFTTHNRKDTTKTAVKKPYILLEGILILTQPEIRDLLHLSIFVTASEAVRFERRSQRDTQERGRTPESVKTQFYRTVQPMHEQFVEPSKQHAGLIVSGETALETSLSEISKQLNRMERTTKPTK